MPDKSIWVKTTTIVLGVIVLCGIWCWRWPYWCPFCPACRECTECRECAACKECEKCAACGDCCGVCPDGAASAEIVIDDPTAALWMIMDNFWVPDAGASDKWVCDPDDMGGATPSDGDKFGSCLGNYSPNGEFRPGVLIQTGTVLDEGTIDHFDEVTITTEIGGVQSIAHLTEDMFDWLDINTKGQKCPLDPLRAYKLFYDDPQADLTKVQVHTQCDDAKAVDRKDGHDLEDSCLRNRSLHAQLWANKDVITYWPDPDALYAVDAAKTISGSHALTQFTFKLCKPVTVDQWNEGCWKQRYENVVEVRVKYIKPSSEHGGFHDPVMDGGPPRKP